MNMPSSASSLGFPDRCSGLLLHPTSLPGGHGIGDLGPSAHRFLDFLVAAGQTVWQVLPLAPPSVGDSPYSALSSFAGNPLLISVDDLVAEGIADADILSRLPEDRPGPVDYGRVGPLKLAALESVADGFLRRPAGEPILEEFDLFRARHDRDWLDDFALFLALKRRHDGRPWSEWSPALALRDPLALSDARKHLDHQILGAKVLQFLFFRQWLRLRREATERGIRIFGDVPIFVAGDSADVWSRPDLFALDAAGLPTVVAGVPPDYFSETGQLWGNPLYRWDAHRAEGFAWWKLRLAKTLEMVDLVRIDHFRGFESCWEIPAGETTAVNGRWVPAPGAELFAALREHFGQLPIVAEDLGIITPEVEALRDRFDLPGMRVLPFEWGEDFKPERSADASHPPNRVFYTGTHDNDTIIGWYDSLGGQSSEVGGRILEYLETTRADLHWAFIRYALSRNAALVILPVQDVLGLSGSSRMNTPGRPSGNWSWRLASDQLGMAEATRLRRLVCDSGRRVPGKLAMTPASSRPR